MSYIGTTELKASDIRRFDVTGSTSATHTLTWTAPTEQSLVVTINGVKQQEDAYSVSGTTLTLTSALVATDKLEVIGINDIGTTITPAQGSVNADKLNTSGTASSSTFLRGDMAWTAVSDVSGLSSVQVFTSSGTWTRPTGITKVIMEVQGGGGGGGKSASGADYNISGGAGGYCKKLLDVSSISSATITVGSGGAGTGYATTGAGSDGGDSSWSDGANTITGGGADGGPDSYYGTGDGGTASGGDINIVGQCGSALYRGGSSQFGQCGHPGNINLSTVVGMRDGNGYGAGGANWSGYSQDCGSGSGGIVIVWEFK